MVVLLVCVHVVYVRLLLLVLVHGLQHIVPEALDLGQHLGRGRGTHLAVRGGLHGHLQTLHLGLDLQLLGRLGGGIGLGHAGCGGGRWRWRWMGGVRQVHRRHAVVRGRLADPCGHLLLSCLAFEEEVDIVQAVSELLQLRARLDLQGAAIGQPQGEVVLNCIYQLLVRWPPPELPEQRWGNGHGGGHNRRPLLLRSGPQGPLPAWDRIAVELVEVLGHRLAGCGDPGVGMDVPVGRYQLVELHSDVGRPLRRDLVVAKLDLLHASFVPRGVVVPDQVQLMQHGRRRVRRA